MRSSQPAKLSSQETEAKTNRVPQWRSETPNPLNIVPQALARDLLSLVVPTPVPNLGQCVFLPVAPIPPTVPRKDLQSKPRAPTVPSDCPLLVYCHRLCLGVLLELASAIAESRPLVEHPATWLWKRGRVGNSALRRMVQWRCFLEHEDVMIGRPISTWKLLPLVLPL